MKRGDRVMVRGRPGVWQCCYVTKSGFANLFRVDGPGSLRMSLEADIVLADLL
jgi:hypothetical protein